MVDYATLAEVKAYGEFAPEDVGDDDLLETLISQVSALFDRLTGRVFAPDVDSPEYFDKECVEGRDLFLGDKAHPLLSVTSLTNGDGTSIADTEYLLLPRGAARFHHIRLKEASSVDWQFTDSDSFIEITGKWGYSSSVPDDVNLATIEAVIYVYKQRKTIEISERAQVAAEGMVLLPSMLPKRTMTVIEHYEKRL